LQSSGSEEFKHFVTKTYYALIHKEETILEKSQLSDLRVFCRMDVGVFKDQHQKYQYFVNKVEASHGTSLFLNHIGPRASGVATDMAVAFRTMVALRRSRNAGTR
jgi:hypothetical protein